MQDLRTVLVIIGCLVIAGLLIHGVWTNKKENKPKFSDSPKKSSKQKNKPSLKKSKEDDVKAESRKEPELHFDEDDDDPLFGNVQSEPSVIEPNGSEPSMFMDAEHESQVQEATQTENTQTENSQAESQQPSDMEVIVFHVHTTGDDSFVGTQLFNSMRQNGLVYGEMDIFHRHTDLVGTGRVLFSVANMLQPGTLAHDDPEDFTTKGISFFMTLPCFGEADQNFKLMLRTAQQIADDLGGQLLDDQRKSMTPNRLDQYRLQIRNFVARNQA